MTVRVLLVRHGEHDLLGRVLCGRMDDVPLNGAGRDQAERLGARLAAEAPAAIFASPQLRAQETGKPIAAACGLPLQAEPLIAETDAGAWTGAGFASLANDPAWARWNADRLHHRAPGGESMIEVQGRVALWLERIASRNSGEAIVAVSHGDVIKAACCHVLGLSVDMHARFEIDPASITTFLVGDWGMKLIRLNQA